MKKRVIITTFAASGLVLVIVGVWEAVRAPKSPVYQGHTVDYWLAEVFTTNQPQAIQVLRNAGSEAAPALTRAFQTTDTSWRGFYARMHPKLPASWQKHLTRPVPAKEIWSAAELIFLNNRKAARAAVPGLMRLLGGQNGEVRDYILVSLSTVIGPQDGEYVPVFIQCLQDARRPVRQPAVSCLGAIGQAASNAVPALTAMLQDTDVSMRVSAATALWKIARQTNAVAATFHAVLNTTAPTNEMAFRLRYQAAGMLSEVDPGDLSPIPALIEALEVSNRNLRVFQSGAAMTLGKYGRGAESAVPALINAVENGDPGLRGPALRSLKLIDPEVAVKYE